ncbi:MAG: hypothetical protein ABJH28_08190 [Paraglaciecola sp.]|uniref:hypothetical protein n=1 Tax=Paraglaciecola sp. TaxID=1920173 RepID=UPI003263BA9C
MKHHLKKFLQLGLLLPLGASMASVSAADAINLNYIEGRIFNDFEITGSYQINSDWFTYASYLNKDHGLEDYSNLEFGGGLLVRGLMDHDLITTASLVRRSVNNYNDTGISVSVGVRDFFFQDYLNDVDVLQPIELRGAFIIEEVGDFDTYIELGADYHFTPNFSAGLQLDLGGYEDTISLGARWFY